MKPSSRGRCCGVAFVDYNGCAPLGDPLPGTSALLRLPRNCESPVTPDRDAEGARKDYDTGTYLYQFLDMVAVEPIAA